MKIMGTRGPPPPPFFKLFISSLLCAVFIINSVEQLQTLSFSGTYDEDQINKYGIEPQDRLDKKYDNLAIYCQIGKHMSIVNCNKIVFIRF